MSTESKIAKIAVWGEKKKMNKIIKQTLSKEPAIRAAAATALGPIREDESFNALVDLIRDPSVEVRKAVIMALGVNGRKAGGEHIRSIMARPGNEELLDICRTSITQIINSDER